MQTDTLGDGIGNQATKDLCEPVEAEPNADPGTLLFLCIPLATDQCPARSGLHERAPYLRREEGEPRGDSGLENTKEESYSESTRVVLRGSHAAKD